jgi:hypothetical protein
MTTASGLPAPYWDYPDSSGVSAPPPPVYASGPKRDLLREAVFLLNVYTQKPQIVAAFVSTVALLASVLTCLVMYTCQWCAARRRRRENALAVRIAENAPVNDSWEHELEQQRDVLKAAPAESEDEEEGVRGR